MNQLRHPNCLKIIRKKSHLPQSVVAFLLDASNATSLSLCENGFKRANIETLLHYHLLFDVPIECLYKEKKAAIKQTLIKRLGMLITEYTLEKQSPKVDRVLSFLRSTLRRLTDEPNHV